MLDQRLIQSEVLTDMLDGFLACAWAGQGMKSAARRALKRIVVLGLMCLSSKWSYGQSVLAGVDADFPVGQIAGRVLGPGITGELQGANPRIAAADIKMAAGAAAAVDFFSAAV